MIPKKNRADRKALAKIFNKSRVFSTRNLVFKFLEDKDQSAPRISFLTPKSASAKSSTRSLLRRRGYRLLKSRINTLPQHTLGAFVFGKNSGTIFGGRKNKTRDPFSALEKEISEILNNIK